MAQVTIDDFGHLPGGMDTETFTRRSGRVAGRRDRLQLFGGAQGDARDGGADDGLLRQAHERHAERRPARARGGPQHLSLLARVHGAIRAAPDLGGRQDRRRLLRHHAGAHQADPFRSALAAAGAPQAHGHRGGAQGQSAGDGQGAGGARNRSSARKLAEGKFVAFVEILPPRGVDASREIEGARLCADGRHRLHQCARRPARQRPHERAGHLPADPAARRHRGGESLLLPRPQYPGHPIGTAGRARGRACGI